MALWLCKQEPSCYGYDDLVRDGTTVWDGVSNALARQHLRQMRPGDRVLFYHTGKEKAVVGEMVVAAEPRPDPNTEDEAAVVVEMRPVRRFPVAVTLAQIKSEKVLSKSDLVRLPRLSVVAITESEWKRVEEMAGFPGKNRKSGDR